MLTTLDAEHDAMAAALTETASGEGRGCVRPPPPRTPPPRTRRSSACREVTVAHLDHEEAELEPVYQANRDSPGDQGDEKKLSKVSPARAGRYFAWLTDGAGPEGGVLDPPQSAGDRC